MAELDPAVIDISRQWLGDVHKGALSDPRLEIKLGDGFEYVSRRSEKFDLIVLDLTDPDTPAFRLYSEEFFRLCQRLLNAGGMLTMHLGSPVYQPAMVRKNAAALRAVFRQVHPLALYIPLYGSLWCLAVASDQTNPRLLTPETVTARLRERRIAGLHYYNAELHPALFTLPTFVRELTDPACAATTDQPPVKLVA
jgi:spermidine synthase